MSTATFTSQSTSAPLSAMAAAADTETVRTFAAMLAFAAVMILLGVVTLSSHADMLLGMMG